MSADVVGLLFQFLRLFPVECLLRQGTQFAIVFRMRWWVIPSNLLLILNEIEVPALCMGMSKRYSRRVVCRSGLLVIIPVKVLPIVDATVRRRLFHFLLKRGFE